MKQSLLILLLALMPVAIVAAESPDARPAHPMATISLNPTVSSADGTFATAVGASSATPSLNLAVPPADGPAPKWQPRLNPANLRDTIIVQVVKHCRRAIVSITAKRIVTRRINPFGSMFPEPMNFGPLVRVPADFLGSGFIIQKDGFIVTNNHVVDQARSISVTLADGRKFPAQVVGNDPHADLAILKINAPAPLATLPLGYSGDLMIGEPTIAVGNPFGYSQSVSSGIVSALHREIHEPNNSHPLKNLIQTDAAINPGNSGGPLLNAYGQVIGINTAIRGNAQNIGFAIGVDRLMQVIPELMDPAQVNRLTIVNDGQPSQRLRLTAIRTPAGPADIREKVALAGTPGPAIVAIDGQPTPTLIDAYAALLRATPAQNVVVVRFADATTRHYLVQPLPPPPPSPIMLQTQQLLGVTVQPVTPALADKYQLRAQSGLLLTHINAGSVAAKAGLQTGDVLVQLGPYRINTLRDLGVLLPHLPHAGEVRIMVMRNGHLGVGTLTLP